jgi:hypothetical protein
MSSTDPRDALQDIFKNLQSTFKKYDRTARRKAWSAVISTRGKDQVDKLLNSPERNLIGLNKLLSFKEWLEHHPF